MFRSILFKEYLKIRLPWLTLLILNGGLMAYVAIATRHLFVMDHAEMVWYQVLHLGRIHYSHLKYAPVVTGLLLSCIQYLPEMTSERLRLTLHLPVSPNRLIIAHIMVGLTAFGLILFVDLTALTLITSWYFPFEAVTTALWTALPWAMAGAAAYLGATLGLLEPNYRLKLFNLAIAAGVVGLYLYPLSPGAYRLLGFKLTVPVLLLIPAVLLPAYRFRYRRVS
ncbi:MAG: hypothetical protein JW786_12815 [Desulfobacterales bacterium]|nr:hypothetical protein [Desulfobacterales bacterium]